MHSLEADMRMNDEQATKSSVQDRVQRASDERRNSDGNQSYRYEPNITSICEVLAFVSNPSNLSKSQW